MRREFPAKVKIAAFDRAKGNCEICGLRLTVGKFRYDHKLPDALGGEPTLENCVVQCIACDKPKTADDVRAFGRLIASAGTISVSKSPGRSPVGAVLTVG